jgi:hypothetical protein
MPENDKGGTPQAPEAGGTSDVKQEPVVFDTWIQGQPDEVKAAYTTHVQGLRNTVQATRQERDALSQQLSQLQTALGKNSPDEVKHLVEQMTHDLEAANRRAAFVEEAVRAEIACSNPKAAYALAQAENLFDRRGNPDWAAIRAAAPELFGGNGRSAIPPGHAGAGTGGPPQDNSMNAFIRRSAGRG